MSVGRIRKEAVMNPLKKRAAAWMAGMFLLIGGFLAAAVILPHRAEPYGAGAPEVEVPRMENVPGPHAPRMAIELEAAEAAE